MEKGLSDSISELAQARRGWDASIRDVVTRLVMPAQTAPGEC